MEEVSGWMKFNILSDSQSARSVNLQSSIVNRELSQDNPSVTGYELSVRMAGSGDRRSTLTRYCSRSLVGHLKYGLAPRKTTRLPAQFLDSTNFA